VPTRNARRSGEGPRSGARAVWGLAIVALLAIAALLGAGCPRLPRERVDSIAERPYPTCPEGAPPATTTAVSRDLRAGPVMRDDTIVEHFEIAARGCHVVLSMRQEWAMGATDMEVVFDAELAPIRVWRRATAPGPQPVALRTEIRRYDLRGERVEMLQRTGDGTLNRYLIGTGVPRVVLGAGRGLVSMWLRRSHLEVGGRVREPVLDIRETPERVRDVTLMRLEDREDPVLGRVRVYTIYGREPIFADDTDTVVGDMMGLLPAERVSTPRPPPLESDGPADPRHP
jgi:hypothetical protein